MLDIIRHKQVSLNDLQEGEYVINEFAGQIKGVLRLNGKLHNSIFNEESNKASLKSEQNDIVINDGVNDRVIIGDIGKTKDGSLYGMKVSKVGSNARFASENKLLINTAKDFLWPAFRVYIDDAQSFSNGGYNTVEFESKNRANVVNEYDNDSNIDYTNHYFLVPYDGIYHFNTSLMFEDAFSEEVDAGEIILQVLYVNADGSGGYSSSDDEDIIRVWSSFNANLLDDKYWTINMTAECKLSAGNKVQWTINNAVGAAIEPFNPSDSKSDTRYNMFTGHLVCLT